MGDRNKVEFLSINRIRGSKFDLVLQIEKTEQNYAVNIIDSNGVFGVELPDELGLKLREFPMVTKEIVKSVENAYKELLSDRHLQAA
ncbi:MAG: hypothetical protein ACR2HT_00615 [Pyrinomonadaceae bacterium]